MYEQEVIPDPAREIMSSQEISPAWKMISGHAWSPKADLSDGGGEAQPQKLQKLQRVCAHALVSIFYERVIVVE